MAYLTACYLEESFIFTARRYAKRVICCRRVSAGFVLASASRGRSAIAELLVHMVVTPLHGYAITYAFQSACEKCLT